MKAFYLKQFGLFSIYHQILTILTNVHTYLSGFLEIKLPAENAYILIIISSVEVFIRTPVPPG